MTRDELRAKVLESNGRAFIGFKDPGATAGVDNFGRVLASVASVTLAREIIRTAGVLLEEMYLGDMPAVVARISSAQFDELVDNPLVEYIEPIFPGDYVDQQVTWNVQRVAAPAVWPTSAGEGAI
ncbi:MAG: hypothetical protein ACREOK_14105, partial [Gemmatimonadaceae bacterium]